MATEENLRVTQKDFKKQYLPVIIWNKKYLSNQVVPITCKLRKMFLAVATFGGS